MNQDLFASLMLFCSADSIKTLKALLIDFVELK